MPVVDTPICAEPEEPLGSPSAMSFGYVEVRLRTSNCGYFGGAELLRLMGDRSTSVDL